MNKRIHKRAVSLVLAFMMAVSCTINISAADLGNVGTVGSQDDNAVQRVYDSGNVVLSNQLVPITKNTYKVKLNIDIKNIKEFLKKAPAASAADETSEEASSGSKQAETKDSGAVVSAAGTDAESSVGASASVKTLQPSAAGKRLLRVWHWQERKARILRSQQQKKPIMRFVIISKKDLRQLSPPFRRTQRWKTAEMNSMFPGQI
jgi:hypothetical protein